MFPLLLVMLLVSPGRSHKVMFVNAFQEMISEIDITSTVSAVENLPNLWAPLQKLVDNANTALDAGLKKNSTLRSTRLIRDMVQHSVLTRKTAHSELVELANSFELLDMSKVSALMD